jgi:tetratricopeptide (TPR) repeat protein
MESAAEAVAELLDASLLGEGAPSRYRSHDLLRAYAAGLDDEQGERPAARERLLDYYVHTAYAANRLLRPHRRPITLDPAVPGVTVPVMPSSAEAYAWLACEEQALLSMVDDTVVHRADQQTVQLVWSLSALPERVETELHLLQVASAAAERLGDQLMTARLELGLAMLYKRTYDIDSAMRHFERALELSVEAGDLDAQAIVHIYLMTAYELVGRYAEMAVHADLALELRRQLKDRDGELQSLSARCWAQVRLGEYRDAIEHGHELLQSLHETDDPWVKAATIDTIGYAHHLLGENEVALDHFENALKLAPPGADPTDKAMVLIHLGETQLALGNRTAATVAWQQALELVDHTNAPMAEELRAKLNAAR